LLAAAVGTQRGDDLGTGESSHTTDHNRGNDGLASKEWRASAFGLG
jgi:hypothetical protein